MLVSMAPKGPTRLAKCPLCSYESKRLTAFEEHLSEQHGTGTKELYVKLHGIGTCRCGCGGETKWLGWHDGFGEMLAGHNGNIYAVYGEEKAREISALRSARLTGKEGWARGLTKDTDERIAARAEATREGVKKSFEDGREAWNKGLTKETDQRVSALAAYIKEEYASGNRIAWQKGLSKETDTRIKEMGLKISEKYKNEELIAWHKGLKGDPRLSAGQEKRDTLREYAHIRWTDDEIRSMLALNVQLKLERIESYRNEFSTALVVCCADCGAVNKVSLVFAKNDRCPNCSPKGSRSQLEIAKWIESLGYKVSLNTKGILGKKEIDIFVPASQFAIEFNGLYWHNEAAGKDKLYHKEKTDRCNEIGIKLFHVFEDEWTQKREIVESMVLSRLKHESIVSIGARNCSVIELNKEERKDFFNKNHIEGDTYAEKTFALKHGDNIIYALSLRRAHHKKYVNDIEIARCCPALKHNVPGAISRLLKAAKVYAAEKRKKRIITYVDTRLGGGKSYQVAGMTLQHVTDTRFWWTDNHIRINRFKVKAENGVSQDCVATQRKLTKIWGCPNLLYAVDV